jgi:glycosyltransferase involved in cell wall biosynthesis
MIEQLERFAGLNRWEIHLYSQKVEDLRGLQPAWPRPEESQGKILWHKVAKFPGPHVLNFLWWFISNRWQRYRDRRSGGVQTDLVYSPGINCLDADVIVVHIVFHEFYSRVKAELVLSRAPIATWARIFHRKIYYKIIMALERRVYRKQSVRLVGVSSLVARQLNVHFQRDDVRIIPNAVDAQRFTPEARQIRRGEARKLYQYSEEDFVVLLIGNDWKKKGVDTLLRAVSKLGDPHIRLLLVGSDDPGLYERMLDELGLSQQVRFERPQSEVLDFYAAADVYAGPSLEDAFNLPILEAMACGLPVIGSVQAGASENIVDGETGLLLRDPHNHEELAELIRRIAGDAILRSNLGDAALRFVRANCSWDQNAERTRELLEEVLRERQKP